MFGIADIVTYTIAAAVLVALLNLKGLLFFPSMMVQLVAARYRKGGPWARAAWAPCFWPSPPSCGRHER